MNESIRLLNSKTYSSGELIESLGAALIIVILITSVFQLAVVNGPSMEPTLKDGDVVVVSKLSSVKEGDVAVARCDQGMLIKRVVNTDDGYFLVGDNRDDSYDSRNFGAVKYVNGKVIWRILPNFGRIPKR